MDIDEAENLIEVNVSKKESSLIQYVVYNKDNGNMAVHFRDDLDIKYFPIRYHYGVPKQIFASFIEAQSLGKFYNTNIKNKFMAKSDKIINGKIDLRKINKEWLFKSEETGAMYLDFVIFYNEAQDKYKQNGMIVQSVPKDVREADKDAKGEILGNVKEYKKSIAMAGTETGTRIGTQGNGAAAGTGLDNEEDDDLPF